MKTGYVILALELCIVLGLGIFLGSRIPQEGVHEQQTVRYEEDTVNIHLYHPRFYVRLVKVRGDYQAGGRIDSIRYMGRRIVASGDPRFGSISLLNASNPTRVQRMYPSSMSVAHATGNNTDRLVLTLRTQSLTLHDGTDPLQVNVTVEYTFYSDIDNVYIWVTLDSTLTAWRARASKLHN